MARPRLRARGSARGAAADPRAPASGELARAQNGTRCVPATAGRRLRRLQEGEPSRADRKPAASIAGRSRTRLVHVRGAQSPARGWAVASPASAARPLGRGPALRRGSTAARSDRGTRARCGTPAAPGAPTPPRGLPDRADDRAGLAEGVLRLRRERLCDSRPPARGRCEARDRRRSRPLPSCTRSRQRTFDPRAGRGSDAHRRLRSPPSARASRAAPRRRADHGLSREQTGPPSRVMSSPGVNGRGRGNTDAAPSARHIAQAGARGSRRHCEGRP